MIRRSILDQTPQRARVNVTPMIDVVMCLIVFYLMVGQLASTRAAGVRVPETAEGLPAGASAGDAIVIGVRPDGALSIDGAPTDADRLEGELRGRVARRPEVRVEVRADRDAPFGVVRPALSAAREAGLGEVDLVTERGG